MRSRRSLKHTTITRRGKTLTRKQTEEAARTRNASITREKERFQIERARIRQASGRAGARNDIARAQEIESLPAEQRRLHVPVILRLSKRHAPVYEDFFLGDVDEHGNDIVSLSCIRLDGHADALAAIEWGRGHGIGNAVAAFEFQPDADQWVEWTPSDDDLFHCDFHYKTSAQQMKRRAWAAGPPAEDAERELKGLIGRLKIHRRP